VVPRFSSECAKGARGGKVVAERCLKATVQDLKGENKLGLRKGIVYMQ